MELNKVWPEWQVVDKLGKDICIALEECEKRKILHRDIKPENIFIDSDGNFKIGDFGVARQLENISTTMSQKGTYNYMAPEVVSKKKWLPCRHLFTRHGNV